VHEFSDGREDGGDRLVMVFELAFEFVELACQGGEGRYLMFWPRPLFKVAKCDLERSTSAAVSWSMKSSGKRSPFRC